MKQFIVSIIILVFASCLQAQTFVLANDQSVVANSAQSITVADTVYLGGTAKTGSVWIWRTSKRGNDYKHYLGTPTQHKYENHVVWTNRDKTKYWFYTINPQTSYPKKTYLTQK